VTTKTFAFALVLLASLSVHAATTNLHKVGITTLVDGPVRVSVSLENGRTTEDCPNARSWRWGSEQACPAQRISAIEVGYRKHSVFIPYSAFADLGNPTSLVIERGSASNTYSIKIVGGDAATSYSATLKFKAELLLEKIVRHGEFPESAWEKTLYNFNVMQ